MPFEISQCARTLDSRIPKGILEVLYEEGPLKSLRVDDDDADANWGKDAAKLLSTKNWQAGPSGRAV